MACRWRGKYGLAFKSVVTTGLLLLMAFPAWAQAGPDMTSGFLVGVLLGALIIVMTALGLHRWRRTGDSAPGQTSSQNLGRRLQLALENSQSGYWDWDVQRNTVEFSDDWKRMFGLGENAVTKDGVSEWMARVHPDDRDECLMRIKRHIKGDTDRFEHEHRLRDEHGKYLWFLTRGRVTERDAAGRAVQMIGVYTDVNAQKRVEELVVHQQQALQRLNEIASLPGSEAKDQLRQALRLGADYLDLPLGIVSQITGDNYRVHVQVSPPGALEDNQEFFLPHCFCVETLHSQDVMAIHHTGQSALASHPCYRSTQLESYIGAPVWVSGEVYGTLNFSAPEARRDEFSASERDFVRLLARWVGATLERSLQERENRKLSETFRRLSDSMPGCLVQFQKNTDGSSRFAYASSGIVDIYGVTPEEVKDSAAKAFERLHPDDLQRIVSGITESERSMTMWNDQYRVLHPTRGLLWIRGRTSPEQQTDGSIIWHGSLWDVTEEVLAEQRLSRTSRWRDAIFDVASLSLIITDVQGVIQSFNVGASRMLGYSEHELLHKGNLKDLHQVAGASAADATQGKAFAVLEFEALAAGAARGELKSEERAYRCKDGRTVRVMETLTAVRDDDGRIEGYLSVARDITLERSQAEKLRASAERTQAILDNAADGIVLIAEDGAIISFNLAAEQIFGLRAAQAQGLAIEALLSEEDANILTSRRQKKEAGSIEVKGCRADGELFPLELSFSEIRSDGRLLYIALMRDITDRKRVERMKNEFIATVSHELRTPLTAISGSLRLLDADVLGELPESVKKMVRVAHNNSERLLNLVNDLLDIEKLVAGKVRLTLEYLVVADLLINAMEATASYAQQFDVALRLDSSDLPKDSQRYLVRADAKRITQVLINLISNAVKFSHPGNDVVLRMSLERESLIVSVVDHGIGIAAEFRERIFQKFSQADSSTTRDKGGTGLGLAISKEIIEQHSGTIDFESREGHGSRFYFALPCTVIPDVVPPSTGERLSVLHVEDDEAILQLLHILVGDAAGLTQVSSVAAAREALATTQYDIVLLDVLLPDGGGLELLETIVSLQPKATEVLALTQVDLTPAQQQRFTRVFAKDAALVAQLSHYLNARMERGGSAR